MKTPTVIVVDENTDFSKIHEQALPAGSPKVKRVLIGIKTFLGEVDFQEWQKVEPREIFEITPTATWDDTHTLRRAIFVTYADGIIE